MMNFTVDSVAVWAAGGGAAEAAGSGPAWNDDETGIEDTSPYILEVTLFLQRPGAESSGWQEVQLPGAQVFDEKWSANTTKLGHNYFGVEIFGTALKKGEQLRYKTEMLTGKLPDEPLITTGTVTVQ